MIQRVYRSTLFALYQISLALGILLMPFALAMNRAGVTLPVHRVVENLGDAYESAQSEAHA
ncbi:hypothetical protein G9464_15750 [Halostella sp. JP-L12]|uniref:hypothetical protein n=1 Tax=Halostella TaxID=1843185 RepID=UPI000EF81E16|nr:MULTISPECIES: hypothetical protein [Halostella]NHN49037.1 hypothetical protein [Halostella sp. JP-L12]